MVKSSLRNLFHLLFPISYEKKRIKHLNAILSNNVHIYPNAQINNGSTEKGNIYIGEGTHIAGILQVYDNAGKIVIGKNCFVGDYSRIYSAANIMIGDNVQIAHNVNIFDNNIHSINPKERKLEFIHNTTKGFVKLYDLKEKPIHIHDNAWIGASSIILKGVTIGKNSIIGAGSVVTKDVPADTIFVGNPAKQVRKIEGINAK